MRARGQLPVHNPVSYGGFNYDPVSGHATIIILGRPAPQGSKVRTNYGMREANRRTKPWRDTIASVCELGIAACSTPWTPMDGPLCVELHCYFAPPKSARRGDYPTTVRTNDADKLARAIGDGITSGGVIKDDSRIVEWHIYKRYTWEQEERAEVTVSVLHTVPR